MLVRIVSANFSLQSFSGGRESPNAALGHCSRYSSAAVLTCYKSACSATGTSAESRCVIKAWLRPVHSHVHETEACLLQAPDAVRAHIYHASPHIWTGHQHQ